MQFIQTGSTYGSPTFYLGFGAAGPSSTVSQKQTILAQPLLVTALAVRFKRPSSGTQTTIFTVVKNGSPTSITITDSGVDGTWQNLIATGIEPFAAGDLLALKVDTTMMPITIESFSVGYSEI